MNYPTKIFDGLTHPNFSDKHKLYNEVNKLSKNFNVKGALAVPLPSQVDNVDNYIDTCKEFDFFYPIGLFDPFDLSIERQVSNFKNKKCYGIKVHPRFSEWNWSKDEGIDTLKILFENCSKYQLPILFCTYFPSKQELTPFVDPMYKLGSLISEFPKLKIILLHGGGVKILDYLEYFKNWDQVLIDFSYTILKYDGSSVDQDLTYSFKNLDKKISFGSDLPYCTYEMLISKIKLLVESSSLEITDSKIQNIMHDNIIKFLDIKI